ncbi:MAG: carbonic anhydrase [Nitrospirota bacterium]
MTNKMIVVKDERDIPEIYRNTPIARLLLYHNLSLPPDRYEKADMLVLMCMDNRQELRLPKKIAFIVRNSGGTLNGVSFSISFAVTVGGIQHIAVIGHSDCMMVDLESMRAEFVRGLSEYGGWERAIAESYFLDSCVLFKKKDAVDSVITEVELIRSQYPDVIVAPLFYSIEDHLLYLIEEEPCEEVINAQTGLET